MHGLMNLLLRKTHVLTRNQLDLNNGEYVNMEELALAHIYIVLMILFEYDKTKRKELPDIKNVFILSDWIQIMQNVLTDFKTNIFGW